MTNRCLEALKWWLSKGLLSFIMEMNSAHWWWFSLQVQWASRMFIKWSFQMFNFFTTFSKDALLHLILCSQEIFYLINPQFYANHHRKMAVEGLVPTKIFKGQNFITFYGNILLYSSVEYVLCLDWWHSCAPESHSLELNPAPPLKSRVILL